MTVRSDLRRAGLALASATQEGTRRLRLLGGAIGVSAAWGATRIRRTRGPIVSALFTAGAFTTALWVQHTRVAWPFQPALQPRTAVVPVAVAATSGSGNDRGRVPIDVTPSTVQTLGIRLEPVSRQSLRQEIHSVATVVPDESRISHVHTRVSGWVDRLDVNTTGETVRSGQPLLRIFSQELLASQTEYLAARRTTSAAGITSVVVAGGRTRMGVLGMSAEEIDEIEQSGEPKRLVTVFAPRSGVVANRGVTVGTSVDPSTTLLTIADLARVWVLAEVPEANITAVRQGSLARLDFPASGQPPFTARVDFVYPTLSERTRTLRVRLSAANTSGALPLLVLPAAYTIWRRHQVRVAMTVSLPHDAEPSRGAA